MIRALVTFSVDLERLHGTCGSQDLDLQQQISKRFEKEIQALDESLGLWDTHGEGSVGLALQQLIDGTERNLPGEYYVHALELITEFFGKYLENEIFYPCPLELLTQQLEEELQNSGAVVRMGELLCGLASLGELLPGEISSCGSWSPEQIAASVEPLRAAPNKSLELQQVQNWLESAAERGEGIVGFYC